MKEFVSSNAPLCQTAQYSAKPEFGISFVQKKTSIDLKKENKNLYYGND